MFVWFVVEKKRNLLAMFTKLMYSNSMNQGELFELAEIPESAPVFTPEMSYKVLHEINRLQGFLRFCPDENGVYIARCEPDYFILPVLGSHFKERFGETSWAIIDEKRRLCLRCTAGGEPELVCPEEVLPSGENPPDGEWENLWRNYHKTINNESRNNPALQKSFIPKRYRKYLTEFQK